MYIYSEFFRILPESIPWLCANGRKPEAERILRRAFKINGDTVPDTPLVDDGLSSAENSKRKVLNKSIIIIYYNRKIS